MSKHGEARILAYASGDLSGIAQAAAACKAGALGVVTPGQGQASEPILACLKRLARWADRPFGVRVESTNDLGWLAKAPSQLEVVIVASPVADDRARMLEMIRRAGLDGWAEVTSRAGVIQAQDAGATGLIVVGNEAGGRGGDESSFILLQGALELAKVPVWVRGGVGLRVAGGCVAIGAAGVVLDGALLLAKESPLDPAIRSRIERWDGGETVVLGPPGERVRLHAPPGSPALDRLRLAGDQDGDAWRAAVAWEVGWRSDQAWPVGQDSAFAHPLARRYVTTGGIITAVARAIDQQRSAAARLRPLDLGSNLATSQGTRYPILQGPMTRVSDVVPFADAVAEGGALPFLALAMLRGPEVVRLLGQAKRELEGRPWGVGLLGFVDSDLRREQVAAVLGARPPFALIAGGRPDQAAELEAAGISTYLHVPSPGLLAQFVRDGARRFVLEGRECGGHVGPRSSFVLWEQAVEALEAAIDGGVDPAELHVVFAGGIHDARSSALVATLAAPLAERGVKLGVLVGTAYLFTREVVDTGAIVRRFQDEAVKCRETVLLETGPGHEVRVAPSPFASRFELERKRLQAEGARPDAIRQALETLNAGRLRVAAKGFDRVAGAGSPLEPVAEADQYDRGVYMLGQVASLRQDVITIEELHASIAVDGSNWLERDEIPASASASEPRPSDIAIVGMSAILPGAGDVRTFWANTLRKVDAIAEIPPDRWDWRLYYDADSKAPDKVVSRWGGFVPDVPFDPLRYGMPPSSLPSIEPVQLLLLEATRAAIADAGYADRPFDRERTAVVLGMGGGAAQLAMGYAFRSYLPMLDAVRPGSGSEAMSACAGLLPEWTEDSFPGFLLNVAAGRVANRFDLGGANYTVDAACGSSLAAAALAVRELETGSADVVLLGGADTVQNPFTYLAFSKTHAFSPRGRCRPFDESADGIVISEGVAMVVLKRLSDAERDGDRIYAVIKGLGASSDGRSKGLTAPNPAGQVRAVERAYAKAGVEPKTVGYVEAHGTGTAVGDVVEVNAISDVFRGRGAVPGSVAIGSVKSMIGHTKCAAGLAGLINATLALHHRILPPTLGVVTPNPKLDLVDGPFRVLDTPQPWLAPADGQPRRAGVSAFGFGGTNFHAVLEAYDRDPTPPPPPTLDWPAELFAWNPADAMTLRSELESLARSLDAGARPPLRDLARSVSLGQGLDSEGPTLAIVASSHDDLRTKLDLAIHAIAQKQERLDDPRGVFFEAAPSFRGTEVAFLFPGQGSQSVGMLGELAMAFPEVREAFEEFDTALDSRGRPRVGPRVFPPTSFDPAEKQRDVSALRSTEIAQPALGAAAVGMARLLGSLDLQATMLGGHSFGELAALHEAGCLPTPALAELAHERGRLMLAALGEEPGAMAAVSAGLPEVETLLDGIAGVVAVNQNGPRQTVVAGEVQGVETFVERARAAGFRAQRLEVAGAFHTAKLEPARGPLAETAGRLISTHPDRPVYSNLDAQPHPPDASSIAERLGDHVARPVQFAAMVESMYLDGARVFVEVGPGAVLTGLVGSILEGRPHLAVATDPAAGKGIVGLLTTLGRLRAAGVRVNLERLWAGRSTAKLDIARLPTGDGSPAPSASTWLVNGSRARPIAGQEPRRLGQAGLTPVARESSPQDFSKPSTNGNGVHSNGHSRNGTSMKPTSPASEPRPLVPTASTGDDRVIAAFQETMRTFLEVQQATMLAYLSGRSGTVAAVPDIPGSAPKTEGTRSQPAAKSDRLPPRRTTLPPAAPAPEPVFAKPTPVESVASRLVAIVRDRTGYPTEMLDLKADLEADLGIDSIKRVEILGTLRDAIPALRGSTDPSTMDSLARARTLQAIVDRVEAIAQRNGSKEPSDHSLTNGQRAANPQASAVILRMRIEAVPAPSRADSGGLASGGVVLVTDDGQGVANALAAKLESEGHPVVLLGPDRVDLSSPASVASAVEAAREREAIAAVIHASPLRSDPPVRLDREVWDRRAAGEVKGLFLLAKATAGDLDRAANHGGSAFVAATALGGGFGSVGSMGEAFAGSGGVAGLVKTLAREWPSVRARVVDFDRSEPAPMLADRLLDEVLCDDDWSEVGYRAGQRIRLASTPRPLSTLGPSRLELDPGAPVVVTGGARGITARMLEGLATQWRPTLLLLGRSPLPDRPEARETAGITSVSELKAAIHGRLRKGGQTVAPSDLEREYQAVRQAREIRQNLETLRQAGATVAYEAVDVRDARALAQVLEGWRQRFGKPVGLVHAAGVIKDKLILDKTIDSFDHVVGTKLDGALNLANLLDPAALRFAAFFSSIAGRFGNLGQSDYAAANEALNKLALWLDERWACRVVSLIWGPWSGVGMVSELEAHLGSQGLGMIPPELGRSLLIDELRFGQKGDVEVIIAGNLGTLDLPVRERQPAARSAR